MNAMRSTLVRMPSRPCNGGGALYRLWYVAVGKLQSGEILKYVNDQVQCRGLGVIPREAESRICHSRESILDDVALITFDLVFGNRRPKVAGPLYDVQTGLLNRSHD